MLACSRSSISYIVLQVSLFTFFSNLSLIDNLEPAPEALLQHPHGQYG
jgi:hypothetical protein